MVHEAHNACLQRPHGVQLGHQVRPGRRGNLQGETGRAGNRAADRDQSSACADIQSNAEVKKVPAVPVYTSDEERDCQGKPLPVTTFYANDTPPPTYSLLSRAHSGPNCPIKALILFAWRRNINKELGMRCGKTP